MATTAVITDFTADLMPDHAAAACIWVVRSSLCSGRVLVPGRRRPQHAAVLGQAPRPGAPIPSTAAPSPGTFKTLFEDCFADGADAIVCALIGAELSGTFQSATVAASMLPDREIHLIDTRSTSMSTGLPALMAAELAAEGLPAAEIAVARAIPPARRGPLRRRGHARVPAQGRTAVGRAVRRGQHPVREAADHGPRRPGRAVRARRGAARRPARAWSSSSPRTRWSGSRSSTRRPRPPRRSRRSGRRSSPRCRTCRRPRSRSGCSARRRGGASART